MINAFPIVSVFLTFAAVLVAVDRLGILVRRSLEKPPREDLEAIRRMDIKADCWMMRYFEPLAIELGNAPYLQRFLNLSQIEKNLPRAGNPLRWTAEEYLGAHCLRAWVLAALAGVVVYRCVGPRFAVIVFLGIAIFLMWNTSRSLARAANRRVRQLKRRLPFAIDLMAIMLESGSDIRQGIQAVIDQYRQHPLGTEFAMVQSTFQGGRPLIECLEELRERLNDEEVTELVFSIRNAEKLGVPMGKTLLGFAEHMRCKQIQSLEQLIGERKVMMVFPGMLVMFACMLVAIAIYAGDFAGVANLMGLY